MLSVLPHAPATPNPDPAVRPEGTRTGTSLKTPKLSELVSTAQNGRNGGAATQSVPEVLQPEEREFTTEELQLAWDEFAEQRKSFQAEYQLLRQAVERRENEIVLQLHNPVQETILNTLKGEVTAFLRKRLLNKSINVRGELREIESKRMIYTSREKYEYLIEKYPVLKELRDRLGLDTDFG